MTLKHLALPALLLALGLACAGEPAVVEPDPPAPTEPTPAPPAAKAGKHKGKAGKHGKAGAPDEIVAAYLEDCAHTFGVVDEDFGGSDDECRWREFDQNCGSDPFGCWSAAETCRDGCQPACAGCQTTCAKTCEDCKASCKGKGATCQRTCAEARATCRTTCLDTKTSCESGCGSAEGTCQEDGEKKRAKLCPHCSDIDRCQWDQLQKQLPREDCRKRFPDDDPSCLDLCFEQ